MYLSGLTIKYFRAIKEEVCVFNKGLNVIIGRNNTGKTAVIDALRICLSYGKQWRDIYISKDDFYIDESNPNASLEPIEFHLVFSVEKAEEAGIFYELLKQNGDGTQEIQLHFKYYLDNKQKIKWFVWGGENEGQKVSSDTMSLIGFTYLSPLRDAVASLRPVRGSGIGELFSNLRTDSDGNPLDEAKKQELAYRIADTVRKDVDWTNVISAGEKRINEHLENTTIQNEQKLIELDFLPFEFRRLVDNIRAQAPIYANELIKDAPEKQRYYQLFQNGLGYNNLIYIATVLGDLINKKQVEPEAYYALLIEEPEAHLHPQLQSVFFSYMNNLSNRGIQLFITSHSPTITSKVEPDSLVVKQKKGSTTSNLSLKQSSLAPINKKFLHKFLDVTKAQLFFANGVILVEGISEALLLPILADKVGYNLNKLGIEVVNVGGVAFEHFAKLFNNTAEEKNLSALCCVITDDDKKDGEMSDRARRALLLEGGNLRVCSADVTFEKELFDKNEFILRRIYRIMHPQTTIDNVEDFLEKLKTNKDKSELAHILAVTLSKKSRIYVNFQVPQYIKRAIEWVAEGKWDVQQPVG